MFGDRAAKSTKGMDEELALGLSSRLDCVAINYIWGRGNQQERNAKIIKRKESGRPMGW